MVKILIADTDIQRNSASCQFLANEKGFEIESTNDGSSTIKKYLEIEPNIFILDSNFTDIKTLEIIDRLSISPIEKRKKNTILTISEPYKPFLIENVSKVYQFLYRPFDNEKLLNTINQMKLEFKGRRIKYVSIAIGFQCKFKWLPLSKVSNISILLLST